MTTASLSAVTNDLITSYGNTAGNVINAYRAGGERVARLVDARWDRAFAESRSQLATDVRKNAKAAHDFVASYYHKGLLLTSNGAEAVVNKFVALAGQGVTQVAANASRFESQTGVKALSQIAQAALPAAEVVSKLASQIEAKSGQLVNKIAHAPVKRRVSPIRKARARKTA